MWEWGQACGTREQSNGILVRHAFSVPQDTTTSGANCEDTSHAEPRMTTHQRNFPSIDPEKLDRLAEMAIKVGLRLQRGPGLFLTAPVAALPLARASSAGLPGRRRPGDPDLFRRGDCACPLPLRPGVRLRPCAGLAL